MPQCSKCSQWAEKYANGKRCRECYNAHMRIYMLKRYHDWRALAVEKLGGKCVDCGSTEQLELDHRNRSQKEYVLGSLRGRAKFWSEIDKCDLRCKPCHIVKTRNESTVGHGGGLTGVKGCYCEKCRRIRNVYMKQWKANRKLRSVVA